MEQIEETNIFFLKFPRGKSVKVDFVHYPYKRIEKSVVFEEISVDSLLDIAVNKLVSIIQRAEVKDFADLYFLIQKFTIWDLIEGVRVKFGYKIEPFLVAADFLKVEAFDFLPKMIKPLTLSQLQNFFREKARELGKTAVE